MSSADKLIARTIQTESGGKYGTVNPNDAGAGIAYGVIQFNQKQGALPDLFKLMHAKDPAAFVSIFGDQAQNLLNTQWVKAADLSSTAFENKLKQAGNVPAFQAAQRELLKSLYLDPAVALAKRFGIKSERGVAMVFDTVVQRGQGNTLAALNAAKQRVGALGALGGLAERDFLVAYAAEADKTTRVTTDRRAKMLTDATLSDAAFEGGGAGLVLLGLVGLFLLWRRFGQ